MRVLVEVFDGQLLHVLEEVFPEPEQGSLSHVDHEPVVEVGASDAHDEHSRKLYQSLCQWRVVIAVGLHHGRDVVVDERLGEECGRKSGDRRDEYTCQDDDERPFVAFEHVCEDALDGCPAFLRHFRTEVVATAWSRTSSYVELASHWFCLKFEI